MLSILFYFAGLYHRHLIHYIFPRLLTAHLPPLGFKPGKELCFFSLQYAQWQEQWA